MLLDRSSVRMRSGQNAEPDQSVACGFCFAPSMLLGIGEVQPDLYAIETFVYDRKQQQIGAGPPLSAQINPP